MVGLKAAFDVLFHLLDQEAAKVEGAVFSPGAFGEFGDVGAQHADGEGAGIFGEDAVRVRGDVGRKPESWVAQREKYVRADQMAPARQSACDREWWRAGGRSVRWVRWRGGDVR